MHIRTAASDEYIAMSDDPKKFYAGGFLYDPTTRRILLQKRDHKTDVNPGKWGFFGGTREGDETPLGCFLRELKEELNIDVAEGSVTPLRQYLNTERSTHRYVYYIETDMPKSEMRLGEGEDFDWISLDTVFALDLTSKTITDLRFFITTQKL
ncbi:MAG: NUDIX domain-containing protein [Patescibacteria group bacterium]